MDNRYNTITDILNSPLFNDITFEDKKPKKAVYDSELEKFLEIIDFVKENNREPYKVDDNWDERKLASRLIGIRNDNQRLNYLKQYDDMGLLDKKQENNSIPKVNSVEDILKSGSSELLQANPLGDNKNSIYDTSSLKKVTTMPDYVARRKKIDNFEKYEILFKACQSEIAEGKRKILSFRNGSDIQENSFYILNGVLLYVEKVGKKQKSNGAINARLKCVFENGTKSNMLLRSLSAELYKNGRRVTDNEDTLLDNIDVNDVSTGYIYVLKSLSEDDQIRNIENLYKIGFTTGTVENRIKNAKRQATFLYAPVEIVVTYQVYNMNVNKFETLLHRVLSNKNLDVSIINPDGTMVVPKEWFVASLEEVQEVINEIVIKANL